MSHHKNRSARQLTKTAAKPTSLAKRPPQSSATKCPPQQAASPAPKQNGKSPHPIPAQDARAKMTALMIQFAYRYAYKVNPYGNPADRYDFAHDLLCEILPALDSYDPSKSKRRTYVKNLIKKRTASLFAHANTQRLGAGSVRLSLDIVMEANSLNREAATEGGLKNHEPRSDDNPYESVVWAECRSLLERLLPSLSPDQRQILELLQCHTPEEIKRLTHHTRRKIDYQIHKSRSVLGALRVYLNLPTDGEADDDFPNGFDAHREGNR